MGAAGVFLGQYVVEDITAIYATDNNGRRHFFSWCESIKTLPKSNEDSQLRQAENG